MIGNPFTPIFGGKPDFFFGRQELLARFERALAVRGSDDRTLFFTGTRGSGKTALLEQLSLRATTAGWRTIDIGAEHAFRTLCLELAECDEVTEVLNPSLEVKVLGSGGSIAGKSTSKTTRYEPADLARLLQRVCQKQKNGVFVSVDEIQKVPIEEVACICEAFQMASRKGLDVSLAVAGLPYSHDSIIHQDACTFMRRAVHEKLGLLDVSEVRSAYRSAFAGMVGFSVKENALEELVRCSSGHPYMMQLLGYHLVEYVGRRSAKKILVSLEDVEVVAPVALESYERRALRPLLDELSEGERGYLRAMSLTANEAFVSRTGDVAGELGKKSQQATAVRQSLIGKGIIVPAGHGLVRFAIPYLRQYVQKPDEEETALAQLEAWGV